MVRRHNVAPTRRALGNGKARKLKGVEQRDGKRQCERVQSTPDNSEPSMEIIIMIKKKVRVIGSWRQITGSKGEPYFNCKLNILTTFNCRNGK